MKNVELVFNDILLKYVKTPLIIIIIVVLLIIIVTTMLVYKELKGKKK